MQKLDPLMSELRVDRRIFLAGAAALAVLPGCAHARTASWPSVRAMLGGYAPARLPGVVAMIGKGTAPAQFIGIGNIAQDSKTPVTPDTLWRVYSMTKPVTGMAAMMLIEDGLVKLEQPVADFIPAFARPRVIIDPKAGIASRAAKGPITIRHLLTHSSGLAYGFMLTDHPLTAAYNDQGILPLRFSRADDPFLGTHKTAPSLAEFADRLGALPLLVDPGTRWDYGVGLDLLGRVIEVASGRPFDAFLQQRLFDPLGMKSTYWRVPASEARRLVTNHSVKDGKAVPLDRGPDSVFLDPPAFPFGGAGLVSSARDYDRFLAMLLGRGALDGVRVMKPETVALGMSDLLPPGISTEGTFAEGQGFGAGGYVVTRPKPGGRALGSFGWEGIAATIGWVDPVRGLRAAGYAQYLPDESFTFTESFPAAVYKDA